MAAFILDQFRRTGVRVLTADGVDLTNDENATTIMVRQILGSVAQFDKSMTGAKLAAARLRSGPRASASKGGNPTGATRTNRR